MEGIKLITFDATNTFLKFKIPAWQYYSYVAQEHGYTVSPGILEEQMKESFRTMEKKHPNYGKKDVAWKKWWKELVKLTFRGQLPVCANVDNIADKLIDEFKTTKCWTVAEGSQDLLSLIRKTNISVGVVSNFDPRLIEILQNLKLHDSFDFIVTSYNVGYSKPDRRIFEAAMKASKQLLKPSECLHVGDNIKKDYEGARSANWHALLVTPTLDTTVPSNHIFKNILDLYNALASNAVEL